MNVQTFRRLLRHGILSLGILLTACVNRIPGVDEEALPEVTQALKVITRSAGDASLTYPVLIYAFAQDGTCATTQTISSASDVLSLSLPKGVYKLVALAGTEVYDMPTPMTKDATITIKGGGFASKALMRGNADITLTDKEATITLVMSYAVADVSINLTGLPTDTKDVSVSLSPLYSTLAMNGVRGANVTTTTATCTKAVDNSWTAPHCYTFGSSTESLTITITITITTESGTHNFAYIHTSSLLANTPYQLNGSYNGGEIKIGGDLKDDGWNDPVDIAFGFGKEQAGGGGTGGGATVDETIAPNLDGSYSVDALPTAGSYWNGHLVALVQTPTAQATDLLLLSLEEWTRVESTNSKDGDKQRAINLVEAYTEGSVAKWRIPTGEEAKSLKTIYGSGGNESSKLNELNIILAAAGGKAFTFSGKEDGHEVRYLCSDASQSFAFNEPKSSNSTAGEVRTYNLRGVSTVTVKTD